MNPLDLTVEQIKRIVSSPVVPDNGRIGYDIEIEDA
jgi:hypothetical protein